MKQSTLILMPHILPTSANETMTSRLEKTILPFTMPLPGPLRQRNRYKTLYGTQSGRDDLLFMCMINSLISFFKLKRYFSLGNFNIFCTEIYSHLFKIKCLHYIFVTVNSSEGLIELFFKIITSTCMNLFMPVAFFLAPAL